MALTKLKLTGVGILAACILGIAGFGMTAACVSPPRGDVGSRRQTASPKNDQPLPLTFSAQVQGITHTWRERPSLTVHDDQVNAVAFSPDGKTLASGGEDHTVILSDLTKREAKMVLRGHKTPVLSVAFSPNGKLVASGSGQTNDGQRKGEVKLWDAQTGKELGSFQVGKKGGVVYRVAFSPDGKILAAAGLGQKELKDKDGNFGPYQDGVVILWDVTTRKELASIHDFEIAELNKVNPWVMWVAFSRDGKTLAVARNDNTVRLWDWAQRKETMLVHAEDVPVEKEAGADGAFFSFFTGGAFAPDGRTLALVHSRAGVKLWDVDKKQELPIKLPKRKGILARDIAFSPDGKTMVTANALFQEEGGSVRYSGEINLWNASTGKLRQTLPVDRWVNSVALSRDGKTLAAACRGITSFNRKEKRAIGDKRGVIKSWELSSSSR